MRLALITDEPYTTGIGKYTINLASELRKKGATVDLFYVQWATRSHCIVPRDARPVRFSPVRLPLQSLDLILARRRRETTFPRGYEIYHAGQQFLAAVLPHHGASVVTVHDLKPLVLPESYPLLLRLDLRRILDGARDVDMIIADSQNTKTDLVRIVGLPQSRVRVIPLGVSQAFSPKQGARAALGLPPSAKILINVGTEDKSKNVAFLLKVMRSLAKEFSDLVLIRVGEKRQETQRLLREFALEDRVIYVRGLSDESLSRYYSASDALLFPSQYEGFGLPPLEAMASGCPVVCSNTSSLPEIVGDAGLAVPISLPEWVEAVRSLLTDSRRAADFRQRGVERAAGFSWSRCADETIEAYQSALRK